MKAAWKLVPELVVGAAVAVALAFGAKEASACTTCDWEPIPCAGEIDPDLYCLNYCVNVAECIWGDCHETTDECLCAER